MRHPGFPKKNRPEVTTFEAAAAWPTKRIADSPAGTEKIIAAAPGAAETSIQVQACLRSPEPREYVRRRGRTPHRLHDGVTLVIRRHPRSYLGQTIRQKVSGRRRVTALRCGIIFFSQRPKWRRVFLSDVQFRKSATRWHGFHTFGRRQQFKPSSFQLRTNQPRHSAGRELVRHFRFPAAAASRQGSPSGKTVRIITKFVNADRFGPRSDGHLRTDVTARADAPFPYSVNARRSPRGALVEYRHRFDLFPGFVISSQRLT